MQKIIAVAAITAIFIIGLMVGASETHRSCPDHATCRNCGRVRS